MDCSTPGSNADTSINGTKASAPKDKACPFCQQQFTSSSLGRHLDLYIKEKNPKPQDGVHDVDEIRKLRGGITRRQPRGGRREGSDGGSVRGSLGGGFRGEGREGSEGIGELRSPSLRREDEELIPQSAMLRKPKWNINMPTWESTGVMNVIPSLKTGEMSRNGEETEREINRRENKQRSVSKQMLAKTTFEQKQKMMEALDNAKAAELALRELLGGVRAAKFRIDGPAIFDYDPLTLDFTALCLHCLPPPPTLYQSLPHPIPTSWSVSPPGDQQYQALREHFSKEFNQFRISCQVHSGPTDDLSYPPPPDELFPDIATDPHEVAQRAEADANAYESRISEHLHSVYGQWNSQHQHKRQEIWMLEMARSLGRKNEEIIKVKKEKELAQQETSHLKLQVDELSRLQHPREFRIVPPSTYPIDSELMHRIGEVGTSVKGVGFEIMDRHMHLDTAIERAIERWKGVVRDARGANGGLSGQRSLSSEQPPNSVSSYSQQPAMRTPINPNPRPQSTQMRNGTHTLPQQTNSRPQSNHGPQQNNVVEDLANMEDDIDADADADADMDDDDEYMDIGNPQQSRRAPEASMTPNTQFRLSNGTQTSLRNEVVQNGGYVRIGA